MKIAPVQKTVRLSPLVLVYERGAPRPEVSASCITLPQVPSAAFGDGRHPTTRLCAGAVDYLCRRRQPRCVLDVGTGSGVLARVARARGADFVVGTDIDPAALDAARVNVALDAHPVEITIDDRAPDSWGPRFELVVANILEAPLRALAPQLAAALAPGGLLLLSGFTPLQVPALRATFGGPNLRDVGESILDGWALLRLERSPD